MQLVTRLVEPILVGLGIVFYAVHAQAAPRTVCLQFEFKDGRESANCALTSETGSLRGCQSGSELEHIGASIDLWDKDPDNSDEFIGRFNYNQVGGTCFSFEWDNNTSANAEHESNPDVYVKFQNIVTDTASTRSVVAAQPNGLAWGSVDWRSGATGDPDKYVAKDCPVSTNCWILPAGGHLIPSNDVNTNVAKRSMVLDSAQHTLEAFAGIMNTNVTIRVPDTSGSCPTACANSRSNILIPAGLETDGIRTAHEMGHIVQMQVFGQDTLRDDLTKNGAGWTVSGDEFDSGASQEGLATYIGLASWYDGGVANTTPLVWGFNFETANPFQGTCAGNRGTPLQVAKSYWDMDDITNESGAAPASSSDGDLHAFFPTFIVQAYSQFAPGTGNRQKMESDSNGVNVTDYFSNTFNSWYGGDLLLSTTLQNHNCIQNQDFN